MSFIYTLYIVVVYILGVSSSKIDIKAACRYHINYNFRITRMATSLILMFDKSFSHVCVCVSVWIFWRDIWFECADLLLLTVLLPVVSGQSRVCVCVRVCM